MHWIDVNDRLPEEEELVLAAVTGRYKNVAWVDAYLLARFYPEEGWLLEDCCEATDFTIRWWMRLPEDVPGGNDVPDTNVGHIDADRMNEIMQAEREGRLLVLPCRIGDTVWLLQKMCKHAGTENKPWNYCNQYWPNVYKKGMWGCAGTDDEGNVFHCEKKEMILYAKQFDYSLALYADHISLHENLFLTREEAEKALEEANG